MLHQNNLEYMQDINNNCLTVDNLCISFTLRGQNARAVRNLSFSLPDQTTLGIVGESGCGKSMTALSIMRLIPSPPGRIDAGQIHFENQDILALPESKVRMLRGSRISMIFQDPMTSLNPVYTCGFQIREVLEHHNVATSATSGEIANKLLSEVGIPNAPMIASSYPHQLSGGMRQRVMIAMALACSPRLLIADEPTTALDVTVQARILDLLHDLQTTKKMSMILITHNLGIVADLAHQIMVMYAGEIMEFAKADSLFSNPLHPYTKSLLETIPHLNRRKDRLSVIPGEVPTLLNIPDGCPFHPRCPHIMDRCKHEHPELIPSENDQLVRCFLYDK